MIAIAAVALLSGCVSSQNALVLDPVGPSMLQTTTSSTSTNGMLMVYSAFRRNADFNSRDPNRQEHSNYEILTGDGELLQKVPNNSRTMLEDPTTVELLPGKYSVKARANGYGFVTVPVIIEARKSTILHLEGGGFWPDETVFNQTNAVRLPDGNIIGWKATIQQ
jgi:hypothetical protein